MKLQVVVNKLNRRKSPVTDFSNKSNVVDVVKNGFVFESVAQIENKLGVWHQDSNGFWAWERGLGDEFALGVSEKIIDYNSASLLPTEFRNANGRNVTIGILDTGCFNHAAFSNTSMRGRNFVDGNDDFEDVSIESHGTFVAGIIAAGACKDNEMKGVATEVSLVIAKITADIDISDSTMVLAGLSWLIEQKPDIINCSFDFSPSNNSSQFDKIFSSDEAKKIIWVAAGQDDLGVFNNTTYYPASNGNFIAVGALKKEELASVEISKINTHIKYVVPQLSFKAPDKFNTYSDSIGSSFAAALVSGNLALVKSQLKQSSGTEITPLECISALDSHIESLSSAQQLQTPFQILKR